MEDPLSSHLSGAGNWYTFPDVAAVLGSIAKATLCSPIMHVYTGIQPDSRCFFDAMVGA